MKRLLTSACLCGVLVFAMTGCEGDEGPAGPAGDVADLTCASCHNETNVITAKQTQWMESAHGMGESYVRGTSASCAGCHSGSAFVEMIDAGLDPGAVAEGDPDPTRQDCRTCHQIHMTFEEADWALRTVAPVTFYADNTVTYDGGSGNLCVNCHQPRRVIPDPVGGMISGISTHWGPHHGPQSAMLLGEGGAAVNGTPSVHYQLVDDTCSACHVGAEGSHTFEAVLETCQNENCHPSAEDFDIGDVQTDVQALADQLGDLLLAANLIDENTPDGHPTVSEAPTAQAQALWNWLYVSHEDKSLGVHNPNYAIALLEEGIALMTP